MKQTSQVKNQNQGKPVTNGQVSRTKSDNGVDKLLDGNFKDERKSKRYFVSAKTLETKSVLPGLRQTIFMDRYSLKNEDGKALEEHPEQMWRRVAKGIAQFEKNPVLRKEW
jgi:ribonucleotide reductase alpha subunit